MQRDLRRESETGEANHERSDPAGGKKDLDLLRDVFGPSRFGFGTGLRKIKIEKVFSPVSDPFLFKSPPLTYLESQDNIKEGFQRVLE